LYNFAINSLTLVARIWQQFARGGFLATGDENLFLLAQLKDGQAAYHSVGLSIATDCQLIRVIKISQIP
jgi:hypothetical protein